MTDRPTLQLGLIGDGIARSRAPRFHELAGNRRQIDVTYTLHDLAELPGRSFDSLFDELVDAGYAGFNVTHPYKARAPARVTVDDPLVCAMGAINTVVAENDGTLSGYNTDYSGFRYAWSRRFTGQKPGTVVLVGAGGAGRAIAFALADLDAREIRIVDIDAGRAQRLVNDLAPVSGETRLTVADDVVAATGGCDGLVNATPIGMAASPGLPVPFERIAPPRWIFDAVYTPEKTALIDAAQRAGVEVFTGFGLFLGQGIDAFAHFSGESLNEADIRYIETTIRHDIARTEA